MKMLTMPLSIREPDGDKQYMIVFSTDESEEEHEISDDQHVLTWAYNSACKEVLQKEGLNPFHQIGEENIPGYHGWELWTTILSRNPTVKSHKYLESLLPKIEKKALENIRMW